MFTSLAVWGFLGIQAVFFIASRLMSKRLAPPAHLKPESNLASNQFSLARLIMWMAGIAVLLGMVRLLPVESGGRIADYANEFAIGVMMGAMQALVLSLFLVPIALPVTAMLLGGRDSSFDSPVFPCILYVAGLSIVEFIALILIATAVARGMPLEPNVVAGIFGGVGCFNCGVLAVLALVLIPLRMLGYRLSVPVRATGGAV
jgi:hypothetical protein